MSEQGFPEFEPFTTVARRQAAVEIFTALLRSGAAPKTFPPPREGQAKPVGAGQRGFALACWARRYVRDLEGALRERDQNQANQNGRQAQAGGGDDGPF